MCFQRVDDYRTPTALAWKMLSTMISDVLRLLETTATVSSLRRLMTSMAKKRA